MGSSLENSKQKICQWIDNSYSEFTNLAVKINDHPELGFAEFKASQWLCEILEKYGYHIESEIANLPTAFRATFIKDFTQPNIALLCEYDALPEIGHGCGHNLIGTASVWAGAALAQMSEDLPGKITILGTPGEETDGGKVFLVDQQYFSNIDAALMFHPSTENRVLSSSLAIDAFEVTFYGKTAHAAGSPHLGINALDAVILTFNGINALRQHLKDDVRIHGIINEGGKAPNVVPDFAQARFYLRAREREYLNEVVEKFNNICKGAALMTGATFDVRKFENSNDNLISNEVLGELFQTNLNQLGIDDILPRNDGGGSTDMGNVSQVVPAIHPYLSIGSNDLRGHSKEFAQATISKEGLLALKNAAKALAMTTLDLLYQPELLKKAWEELKAHKA